ncbi:MAG: RNA polymerase sigma factor [Myxococcota bacterium]
MFVLATFFRRRGSIQRTPSEPGPHWDPDQALMLRFQGGDEEAFVQLYETYRDRIVAFTTRMMGSTSVGEEAAQDVFLKIYGARKRYQPTARFSTYIYRVATRHCLNLRDRHAFKKTSGGLDAERETGEESSPADETRKRELREALQAALAKLPDTQRAALVLVHYEGLSYRECAESLGVTESAIKSMIHRARSALTQLLDPELSQPMEFKHAM